MTALILFSCYNSQHQQLFTAWANSPNCDPTYSIYQNGSWSTPAFINVRPPGVLGDIFLTYNFLNDQVFATWTDCVTDLTYYSIYVYPQPVIPILPPTHLTGQKKSNKFLDRTEWYVQLMWRPPASGAKPVSYRVYRDHVLIGTVQANSNLTFRDFHVNKNQVYLYEVTSVDAQGRESEPATVVVGKPK